MTTLKPITKEKEKTMDMEYPEEIYQDGAACTLMSASQRQGWAGWGRRFAYRTGFDVGKAARGNPLEGYSNLTEAIKAGEPIGWERLDGLRVQCVNPDVGTSRGTLKRELGLSAQSSFGWWNTGADISYTTALVRAWDGRDGWTLWLEGEVPLRRKTADQLPVGTYFMGEAPGGEPDLVYVGGCSEASKAIYYTPSIMKSTTPASRWLVVEELGPCPFVEGVS